MASVFRAPPENLSIPLAAVLAADVGTDNFKHFGDVENFALNVEVQEVERYSKFGTKKTLRAVDTLQVDATVTFEVKDMSKFVRALSVGGSEKDRYTQAAQSGTVAVFSNVKAGDIFPLGYMNVSNVVVFDGAATTEYVEGVNFVVLDESGYVQITSVPSGADTDLQVTFDAAEITAAEEKLMVGIGSDFNIRKTLRVVNTQKIGPRDELVLHDVQLRAEGDKQMISSGDDYTSITLKGRVFLDETQEEDFQIGYLKSIS